MYNLFNLRIILTVLSLLVFSQLTLAFTYQGEISQLGSTYDGPANMDFTLYDAAGGGNVVGGVDSQTNITVSNGRFVVDLDQWIGEFDGRDFWLEIAVDLNTGVFTTLNPRQKLAAAPYAEYAYDGASTAASYTAGTGLTLNGTTFNVNVGSGNGLDADLLDGKQATEFANTAQITAMQAQIDQLVSLVATQNTQISNLENKTQYISVTGTEIYITGANLSILSGSGNTDGTINGLGNLIIGYNEFFSNVRTGSHNLVVGRDHSYSSYGGIVTGSNNRISGKYSSITGGTGNKASGDYSSVTGGKDNNATGEYSGISGGLVNYSIGNFSSVSGGVGNYATGSSSSISGGQSNRAEGTKSSILGGGGNFGGVNYGNRAYGQLSTIVGGRLNRVGETGTFDGDSATVVGGYANKASGDYSIVVGGGYTGGASDSNEAYANYSVVVGGFDNTTGNGVNRTVGQSSTILGGEKNTTLGATSSVVNGYQNSTGKRLSVVLGGNGNFANGEDSTIVGGFLNTTNAFASSVSGGQSNTANGLQSTVSGGNNRTAVGTDDWVGGSLAEDN